MIRDLFTAKEWKYINSGNENAEKDTGSLPDEFSHYSTILSGYTEENYSESQKSDTSH